MFTLLRMLGPIFRVTWVDQRKQCKGTVSSFQNLVEKQPSGGPGNPLLVAQLFLDYIED